MPSRPHPHDEATRAFARYRASGAPADLAAVFDATALGLSVLAGHLARRAGDAEDLVQQTFLVAMRDAHTWDGERPVAAWLAGILRHRALELSRRRERSRSVGDAPLDDLVAHEPSPLDLAADAETAERIAAAIARIDGPSQQVLALRLVHGLEPTAIAHALGRPPGTVRMQLARGLERLRELLPASLATVLAGLALETRGLAAVRAAVLAAVPAPTVATVTATPVLLTLAMKKWIALAALVLVAVVVAVRFTLLDRTAVVDTARSDAERSSTVELAPTDALVLAPTDAGASRTSVVAEPLATATEPAASLTVTVVSTDDGTPRPDIGVVVSRVGGGTTLRSVTNASGAAHFANGIANGQYEVGLDRRSGSMRADVEGTSTLTYELEPGVDIFGRVVDFHGDPVADARVGFVDEWRRQIVFEIARTDAEGRFTAAAVESHHRIVAQAAGHQISAPEWVGDGSREVVLTLGARGHTLRGRVLDTSGAPVPFARVVVGSEQRARRAWSGASAPADAPPKTASVLLDGTQTVADEHGRYELDEVPAGPVVVIARPHARQGELVGWAHGFVEFEGALELDVTLAPGARIVGTLTDTAGRPYANQRVDTTLQRSLELGTFFGDVLFTSMLDNASVSTDENGAFAAVGLLPGVHAVEIGPPTYPGEAIVRKEMRVRAGETVRFDPSVERGVDQPIRLVGLAGEPLIGWLIDVENAHELGLGWFVFLHTDAEGRTRVRGLAAEANFAIKIRPPGDNSIAVARRSGLVASGDEIVITLAAHEQPSSSVVAELASAPSGIELLLTSLDGLGWNMLAPDATGTVRFDGVAPGEYRIETEGAGHPRGDVLAEFTVEPNTVHDVGTLVLPERGRVVLDLECDDGAPASLAQVVMRSADGREIKGFEHTDSGFTSPPLIPGTYTLNVVPADAAPFDATIDVDERALQRHRLACSRGARVHVEVAPFKGGTTLPLTVELIVGRPGGGHLFSRTFTRPAEAAHFEFDVHLAPATYHCWAWEPDGPQRPPFDTDLVVTAEGVELRVVLD